MANVSAATARGGRLVHDNACGVGLPAVGSAKEGLAKMRRKALFGAGCFWGVEAAFRQVDGVLATIVGYAGGHTDEPTYKQVCTGTTGHAEVVEVEYDDERASYDQLLDVFWENHDPTQVNRQGPDVGSQYRSAIFFHDDQQRQVAEASRVRRGQAGLYRRPIATEVTAASTFWRAEEYHQQYLEKSRGGASCRR